MNKEPTRQRSGRIRQILRNFESEEIKEINLALERQPKIEKIKGNLSNSSAFWHAHKA